MRGVYKKYIALFFIFFTLFYFASLSFSRSIPFYDDFENVGDGKYPSINGWENWGENFNGYDAYVTNEISYNGSKSFKLIGWNTEARVECISFESIPDKVTYEIWVYIPNVRKGGAIIGFGLERGALVIVFNAVCFDPDGKIVFKKDYHLEILQKIYS